MFITDSIRKFVGAHPARGRRARRPSPPYIYTSMDSPPAGQSRGVLVSWSLALSVRRGGAAPAGNVHAVLEEEELVLGLDAFLERLLARDLFV